MKKEVVTLLLLLAILPLINAAGCTSFWRCNDWSPCMNNEQIRICYDTKTCGNMTGKPSERQACGTICDPGWQCTGWNPSSCDERGLQTRNCADTNSCGILEGKPEEAKSCQFSNDYSWIFMFIVAVVVIFIIGAIWILIKKFKNR